MPRKNRSKNRRIVLADWKCYEGISVRYVSTEYMISFHKFGERSKELEGDSSLLKKDMKDEFHPQNDLPVLNVLNSEDDTPGFEKEETSIPTLSV